MALTSVDVAVGLGAATYQIPGVLSAGLVVDSSTAAQGFAFTNSGPMPRFVEIIGDGNWYWHQSDAQTGANMRKVGVGAAYGFQVPFGSTINLYTLSVSGNVTLVPTVER